MDYFITDTSTSFGMHLVDAGRIYNGQFVHVSVKDTILRYTPLHVKEYGFKDGRVWVRKPITLTDTTNQAFLQRLVNGKISLYYFETETSKSYYLEKENRPMVQQPIPGASQQISELPESIANLTSDCEGFNEMAKDANYQIHSFTKLIKRYNLCQIKPFPHFRYGIHSGIGLHKINPSVRELKDFPLPFDFTYESGWILGAFIDFPLLSSQFSIDLNVQYEDLHYVKTSHTDHDDYDMIVNSSALQFPATIRYTFPFRKLRPLLEAGGVVTYHPDHEITIYHSILTDSIVEIQHVLSPGWISELTAGFVVGLGFEYAMNLKHSFFLETRYMNQYLLNGAPETTNENIQICLGYNF